MQKAAEATLVIPAGQETRVVQEMLVTMARVEMVARLARQATPVLRVIPATQEIMVLVGQVVPVEMRATQELPAMREIPETMVRAVRAERVVIKGLLEAVEALALCLMVVAVVREQVRAVQVATRGVMATLPLMPHLVVTAVAAVLLLHHQVVVVVV
jgi:hypothetical protein